MDRAKALRKLEHKIRNPDSRSIEENAPRIHLKNGKRIMVEDHFTGPKRFTVSIDFGCTCRELGRVPNLEGVLDIILEQGR